MVQESLPPGMYQLYVAKRGFIFITIPTFDIIWYLWQTKLDEIKGAIVCKLDQEKNLVRRGYIAMLAVDPSMRKRGIGRELVRLEQ